MEAEAQALSGSTGTDYTLRQNADSWLRELHTSQKIRRVKDVVTDVSYTSIHA